MYLLFFNIHSDPKPVVTRSWCFGVIIDVNSRELILSVPKKKTKEKYDWIIIVFLLIIYIVNHNFLSEDSLYHIMSIGKECLWFMLHLQYPIRFSNAQHTVSFLWIKKKRRKKWLELTRAFFSLSLLSDNSTVKYKPSRFSFCFLHE